MAFPETRIRTCATGQSVIPDDINEIQDAIIDGKHALHTRRISAFSGQAINGATPYSGAFGATTGGWQASAAGSAFLIPLPVRAGERIVNVRIKLQCGSGDAFSAQLMRGTYTVGLAFNAAIVGTPGSSSGGGNVEQISFAAVNESVGTDSNYYVLVSVTTYGGSGNGWVWGAEIDVDAL